MIFWRIAVFIFAFNLVLGFVNSIPLDSMGNDLNDNQFGIAGDNNVNITDRFATWNASAQNVGDVNLGFGDVVGGVNMFIGALSDSTILLPSMLASFGLPATLITVFTGLTWLSYGAGMIQLWTGRDPEA